MLTFGSLFSGIGGFDLGLERAGMRCAWQCEIDPAARSILRRHFPEPQLYEDVTKLTNPAAVDVLCGGFPCQDLSVAGRRAGLAGKRSGLWHEFRRVAEELAPRVVLIENVPGLLSSHGGADFMRLLQGLADIGYRLAWRVLDSQYDRVAQRRRRVFVVGSLGDGRCAEILFERESLRWDFAPGREAGQEVAGALTCGIGKRGFSPESAAAGHYVAHTLQSGGRIDGESETFVISPTLRAAANNSHRADSQAYVVGTLNASGRAAGSVTQQDAESGLLVFSWNQSGETALGTSLPGGCPMKTNGNLAVAGAMGVRRLTPRECERLQAFPDDWTRWRDDGREQKDGPRYRQLGNAVNVRTATWLGQRIVAAIESEVAA